ncbi:MAG: hypothetical protein HC911_18245 [Chloroflexaceae bacterium]|nr:hypothetical protein [Chloroflexaceae bacterium]
MTEEHIISGLAYVQLTRVASELDMTLEQMLDGIAWETLLVVRHDEEVVNIPSEILHGLYQNAPRITAREAVRGGQ